MSPRVLIAPFLLALACSGGGTRTAHPAVACVGTGPLEAEYARHSSQGYLGRALRSAERILAACPSASAHQRLGAVLTDLGLRTRAIAAYRQAGDAAGLARAQALPVERVLVSEEQQAEARLYYRRGFDLRLQGDNDRAIALFRSSYQHWPHPLTIVQIGLAHQAAGRVVEYRKANARALALAESTRGRAATPTLRTGHTAAVTSLAFHPTRPVVVTSSDDGRGILWDLRSGRMIDTLEGHTGKVKALALSPDGRFAVTAGADGTARVWDLTTAQSLRVFRKHTTELQAAAFSPDGLSVATASYREAMVWNPATAELISIPRGISKRTIAFSPDGKRLVAGSGPDLRMWDPSTGVEVGLIRADLGDVHAAAFSPDGALMATGGSDRQVHLWDASNGAEVAVLEGHLGLVNALAFSPDGATLVSTSRDHTAIVWDVNERRARLKLEHPDGAVSVAVSPDGSRIMTGGESGEICEWDASSGALLRRLVGGGSAIISFDATDEVLISGSFDGTVKVWDVSRSHMQVLKIAPAWVLSVKSSAAGSRFAAVTGMGPSTVSVREVADGKVLFEAERPTLTRSVALSPDGRTVVLPGEATEVWDVESGTRERSLDNGPYLSGGVLDLTSRLLALTGVARIRTWPLPEASSPRDIHVPGGQLLWSLAVSRDGALIAGGDAVGLVHLWEAATGAERAAYHDHTKHVWSLQFSDDGARIASGGDGTIVIRSSSGAADTRASVVIDAHGDRVEGVRFARGGELVVSASRDQTIAVHDARTGALRARLFGTRSDGWVVIGGEGEVDGDQGAPALIDWHVDDVILPGYVGWQRNRTPGLLRDVLAPGR